MNSISGKPSITIRIPKLAWKSRIDYLPVCRRMESPPLEYHGEDDGVAPDRGERQQDVKHYFHSSQHVHVLVLLARGGALQRLPEVADEIIPVVGGGYRAALQKTGLMLTS